MKLISVNAILNIYFNVLTKSLSLVHCTKPIHASQNICEVTPDQRVCNPMWNVQLKAVSDTKIFGLFVNTFYHFIVFWCKIFFENDLDATKSV